MENLEVGDLIISVLNKGCIGLCIKVNHHDSSSGARQFNWIGHVIKFNEIYGTQEFALGSFKLGDWIIQKRKNLIRKTK